MSTPFMGEIKLVACNFAPKGWAECNGQFMPINQNQALFSLLGTTYGGNGQTTFALPDLRSRVPIHMGNDFVLGERAGQEFHTLNQSELPAHNHIVSASASNATTPTPSNAVLLARSLNMIYSSPAQANALTATATGTITNVGGSQPHENRQPFLVLLFCIALQGIFPSQN